MSNKEYKPTLAQLRTFVTIAENKHFGTAAQKLNISQPSLSQALVALENGLDIQLIERSTRKVIVTSVGEMLLPYAKATLDAADSFLNHARGANGDLVGPLTIGIIPTVAPYILPNLLRLMADRLPDSRPCIIEDQTKHLLEGLRDGQVDCAIMALPIGINGVNEKKLYDENFLVVVPEDHRFAGRNDLTLSDLHDLGMELLLLDDGHCLRDQIIDLCHKSDVAIGGPGTITTRAASLSTVMECVAGGLGATLVPASAVPLECNRPGLAIARFAPSVTAKRTIALAYRGSSSRDSEFEKFGQLVEGSFRRATNNQPDVSP
ncbi:hydrogen peroxide-inducible genes activator [Corynebacterium mendelii]|uniref:Probable hydrogen peroxide-inducible genes activator n=1 Tax=Corynebacterium mendelii TaxID=2765362 RepID=A0A939DY18_9CORY|nr:hydrogen peroxide-inducible genes activator [Corynebacterium mendelii]MBN9643329.1 hydrogen peroxide-inducible genes activator [Corynebacterium mendelii]